MARHIKDINSRESADRHITVDAYEGPNGRERVRVTETHSTIGLGRQQAWELGMALLRWSAGQEE